MGIASIFMPTLCGIIADRWINAEKLYGVLHILGGITLLYVPQVSNPTEFFWTILIAMIFYMPTIALSNSVAYNALKKSEFDVVKDFPPIRVWGTIGFIVAMWITNLTGNKASENQFYIAAIAAILLGIYSFTLPKEAMGKEIEIFFAEENPPEQYQQYVGKNVPSVHPSIFGVFSAIRANELLIDYPNFDINNSALTSRIFAFWDLLIF